MSREAAAFFAEVAVRKCIRTYFDPAFAIVAAQPTLQPTIPRHHVQFPNQGCREDLNAPYWSRQELTLKFKQNQDSSAVGRRFRKAPSDSNAQNCKYPLLDAKIGGHNGAVDDPTKRSAVVPTSAASSVGLPCRKAGQTRRRSWCLLVVFM